MIERHIRQGIAIAPFDRLAWQAEQGLISAKRDPRHLFPARLEIGCGVLAGADARIRRPHAGGIERAHVRQPLAGINAHAQAGALRCHRRGQPNRATADHCQLAHVCIGRAHQSQCVFGCAPRQRPTAAAVPVVVHHRLAPDAFCLDARTLRTERPRAAVDGDDAIDRCAHRRQCGRGSEGNRQGIGRRQRCGRRNGRLAGASPTAGRSGRKRKACAVQKMTAVHATPARWCGGWSTDCDVRRAGVPQQHSGATRWQRTPTWHDSVLGRLPYGNQASGLLLACVEHTAQALAFRPARSGFVLRSRYLRWR